MVVTCYQQKNAEEKAKEVIKKIKEIEDPSIRDGMISASIKCPACKKGILNISFHDEIMNIRCDQEGCIGWSNEQRKQTEKK